MKEKKRYSMRGKMIKANIGIILTTLVLCGSVFVISVFLIVGKYIHTDINYFLTTTADNMEAKLAYCEEAIYSVRDSKEVMEYLEKVKQNSGEAVKKAAKEEVEAAFGEAVDISATANLGNGNIPLVEEICLFDCGAGMVSSGYYAMISEEKEENRKIFQDIYHRFKDAQAKGKAHNYKFYQREGYVYLVFTLYDDGMDSVGEMIYKISETALFQMMEDMANYEDSFWALYDTEGNYICGEGEADIESYKAALLDEYHNSTCNMWMSGRKYRIYRKPMGMDQQLVIGIPENQTMLLMYDSAKLYVLLIAIIAGMGCILSFFIIYRLIRPIEEITDKLLEVKEGDFETKLPGYDSREFNEISETFNGMTAYISHLIKQVYEKQISIKDMELRFLQAQMNPHFMFNVLNTIALQARLDNNEDIYRMISSFSQLIQAKIYRSGKEKVKIGQELEYVEYYLYLQSYRFGEHLHYEIEVENESLKELYIPKLCIQLTVENAVVHGVEPKLEEGTVRVKVYRQEDMVCVDTLDDGVGFEEEGYISLPMKTSESDRAHNHVGLNNAHHIIRMMYGEGYGITVFSKKGGGTRVSIRIPFDTGSEWETENVQSNAGG